jgi:nitrite reductase/ring-hydroxylating ferredoxin subunit
VPKKEKSVQRYWHNGDNALQEGAVICSSKKIQEGKANCMEIISNHKAFPIILTRIDGEAYCYINACPHQYLPLNYRSKGIISSDRNHLLCSAHGAIFDIKTGECQSHSIDELDSIPVFEDQAGNLCIGRSRL